MVKKACKIMNVEQQLKNRYFWEVSLELFCQSFDTDGFIMLLPCTRESKFSLFGNPKTPFYTLIVIVELSKSCFKFNKILFDEILWRFGPQRSNDSFLTGRDQRSAPGLWKDRALLLPSNEIEVTAALGET